MGQHQDNKAITLVAGAALEAYRLVKWHSTAGQVVHATASDLAIGFTTTSAESGAVVKIIPLWMVSTFEVELAGAVAAGAKLYTAAAGTADDSGTRTVGTALQAGAAGAVIEAMPLVTVGVDETP